MIPLGSPPRSVMYPTPNPHHPDTVRYEAAKAKMALLDLSDTELMAGINRLPAGRRAALFDKLTGTLFPHHYKPFCEAAFSEAYTEKLLRARVDRAMLGPMPVSHILLAFSGAINFMFLLDWWISP